MITYESLAGGRVRFYPGDCLEVADQLPGHLVDAVVCDPPYPGIKRDYGEWTVDEWFDLMNPLVMQIRDILKPHGSAVFILQPNSERLGRMSPWLWQWMAFWAERFPDWGIVQDVYWWNTAALPTIHTTDDFGLMRPSLKYCVWMGPEDCYRDQGSILWTESQGTRTAAAHNRTRLENGEDLQDSSRPSGHTCRTEEMYTKYQERGGVTPFNVIPLGNVAGQNSAGVHGHGAGTPNLLTRWWVRYLTRPGDVVWDPFGGSGTTALEAVKMGRRAILCEKHPPYQDVIRKRFESAVVEDRLV